MPCECGEEIQLNKSINIFKDHVLVVTTCNCGRRIHQSYNLVESTFFKDDKIEKTERKKW